MNLDTSALTAAARADADDLALDLAIAEADAKRRVYYRHNIEPAGDAWTAILVALDDVRRERIAMVREVDKLLGATFPLGELDGDE